MAGTKHQVAVVGCGRWGRNLVRNFAALGALAAVCDHDGARAREIAAAHGAVALSLPTILSDAAIVGVVIATPAETHAAVVRECLLAGKDVFVEKPLALDVADAQELVVLARARGRILMVGHLMQYHPGFLELRRLCAEGRLGRLQYVYSSRLNLGKIRTEENSLWSFAPHDASMILSLFDAPVERVSAIGHCYLHKSIADVTTTHITFSGGQAAHIFVSWLNPFKEQRLVVVGDAGMAVFEDTRPWNEKLLLYPHRVEWHDGVPEASRADATAIPLDPGEPLEEECQHFLGCIADRSQPRTNGDEGLAVLRVLQAAQSSIETGGAVTLAPPAPDSAAVVHETAVVDHPSWIGAGTRIWHFSHVLKNSRIGQGCNIGQNVVIGPDVVVGDRCKIQNNVSVYPGVTLEDGVFCGPSMVFTNVVNPRAEIERKSEYRPTVVRRGATIGANATVICGYTVGRWALIGAGAVVARDVPDHALMVGNPARRIGWVCVCGVRLPDDGWESVACPACGRTHILKDGAVVCLNEEGK